MMRLNCIGPLALSLVLAGCGSSSAPTNASTPPAPAVPPPLTSNQVPPPEQSRETVPTDSSTATQVALDLLPWEGVQELVAGHKGKVVVVDLWATYCVPCRAEFPGLVELSRTDPENVVCISVSLDDPDDEAKAKAFLEEQHATLQNVLCTTESDVLYDEILQIGGIPAVYVYGRDGTLAKVFTGPTPEGTEHTYHEHIAPFVQELAAQN